MLHFNNEFIKNFVHFGKLFFYTFYNITERGKNKMRVERIQNTPNNQTFAMAYYLKSAKNINNNYHNYYVAIKQMHVYAHLKTGVCARGYQQFQHEMGKLYLYDVAFDHDTKSMQVIERATGKIVESFDKSKKWQKGINSSLKKWFPGKTIFSYIFDPKQFLPANMLKAGKRAKELERVALENM